MKDLFISMGERVSARNFTDGAVRYREMPAAEIAPLIEDVRAQGGKVMSYFNLGSVPSKKKTREFQDLVDAFEKVTGVRLSPDDFMSKANSETGGRLPNFNFIPTITDTMSMVAVEYYFSPNEGVDSFDDWLTVCDTGMNFHYFERA